MLEEYNEWRKKRQHNTRKIEKLMNRNGECDVCRSIKLFWYCNSVTLHWIVSWGVVAVTAVVVDAEVKYSNKEEYFV